jgi:hypothetical protein
VLDIFLLVVRFTGCYCCCNSGFQINLATVHWTLDTSSHHPTCVHDSHDHTHVRDPATRCPTWLPLCNIVLLWGSMPDSVALKPCALCGCGCMPSSFSTKCTPTHTSSCIVSATYARCCKGWDPADLPADVCSLQQKHAKFMPDNGCAHQQAAAGTSSTCIAAHPASVSCST